MIDRDELVELLRVKGEFLYHREGQCLEFKEQFNLAGLADYLRDFAAFANNRGGMLVFGVTDAPRRAAGLSAKALDSFNKLDPELLSGFILENFSCDIGWEATIIEHDEKHFGAFKVDEAAMKPVISRKNEGRNQTLKNGDIYFRYGGRTQRIQSAELEAIINKRIESANRDWINLVKEIGPTGPRGAFILKPEEHIGENAHFVVDRGLAQKLKFVKEGHFNERKGAEALKLVGDVVPVDTVEVEKIVKENLLDHYPLSASELADAIVAALPFVTKNMVWDAIKENGLKANTDYASYNFRNMKQQKVFEDTGKIPSVTPSIYSATALAFLIKFFENTSD